MILERIPGERWSRVLPAWKGKTVAILAGGPSLTRPAFEMVRAARDADRLRVIAINDSYLLAPWADVHYAADVKWHRWHKAGIDKPELGLRAEDIRARWAAFRGERCSIQPSEAHVDKDIHVLRNSDHPRSGTGLSLDPRYLVTGRHGGFQSLNIAILSGAVRVLLLGYDANLGARGETHWHGDHPIAGRDPVNNAYQTFRRSFTEAEHAITATGVKVLNCSLTSAIDTFPKVSLDEALCAS